MKTGVIYARYSSDRQNEQSIAGQVDICKNWALNNDIAIVDIYHDEALTGTNDKRPDFQRMVNDAKTGKFDYVIVYKLDRFARNRYDSAIYKAQLNKYGAKVVSAMENIGEGPEAIILESMLEGMAEYFSANLSQNVLRGMKQKAEQGKYMGGIVPLGYKVDEGKNYVIDKKSAFIVKKIYDRYANGYTIKEIVDDLNRAGYKSSTGKPFTYTSLHRILTNQKYIGRYEYLGIVLENTIPRIIDDETFEKVQQRKKTNKNAPAKAKSSVNYHLTGKLFCGCCGSNMVGDSGTSSTGATHFYYSCIEKKRKHGCKKKSVKKDWIEQLITDVTINQVLTDENIKLIAEQAFALHEKEREDKSEINALKNTLRETEKVINNIMNAIEQGIITETTRSRLMEAEERKEVLLASIEREQIQKPQITKEHIEFFLYDMKEKIYNAPDRTEIIIKTFVNAVYLYDDKMVITFNFKDGNALKKLKLTDIEKFGYDTTRCTISILSELFMFAIIVKLRG